MEFAACTVLYVIYVPHYIEGLDAKIITKALEGKKGLVSESFLNW